MAYQMGFDALSVSLTLTSVVASACRGGDQITMMREVEPPGINALRIGALEQLAQAVMPGMASEAIAAKLAEIEAAAPRYSVTAIAAATGVACGAFAFLNGGGALEVTGAVIGSGIGQWVRSRLSGVQITQYGVTLLFAVAAAGVYSLIAAATSHIDFGLAHHTSGSLSSILFLLPSFPLVTALSALIVHWYLGEALIAIAVPGIIIMTPGSYALQTVMLFH